MIDNFEQIINKGQWRNKIIATVLISAVFLWFAAIFLIIDKIDVFVKGLF